MASSGGDGSPPVVGEVLLGDRIIADEPAHKARIQDGGEISTRRRIQQEVRKAYIYKRRIAEAVREMPRAIRRRRKAYDASR
ncbi:hypothetical protein NL676_037266 [Syzygium grande]|nr:hypothetical protein NL676_037266 [Syzygium grande]